MNRSTVLGIGFSLLFSFSVFAVGCSDETSPTTKADGGKTDGGKKDTGSGGGGSGGTGGSGGRGGSGGSSSGGSGGSAGSGGSSNSGGSGGSGGAGGSAATGGAGGSGGAGGTSGTGGTLAIDAGNVQLDAGGGHDAVASDAVDAPLLGDDGATAETGASDDSGVPNLVDTGAQDNASLDSEAVDTTVVFLDAEVDTSAIDVSPGLDSSADLVADLAADAADAGTCLQQIISQGYAFTSVNPCSQCQDVTQTPPTDLHTQCQGMIDCLAAASCQSASNNCWVTCRNAIVGNQIATEACVAALVTAACQ